MEKTTIEVSTEDVQPLLEVFGLDGSATSDVIQPLLTGLAQAALGEYLLMIGGRRNPTTVRDARELRLSLLAHHLPHHLPSDRQVAELFQLTPTQAKTLVSGTRARYRKEFEAMFSEAARRALREARKISDDVYRIEASDSLATFLGDTIRSAAPPVKRTDASYRWDLSPNTVQELCELLSLPIADVATASKSRG